MTRSRVGMAVVGVAALVIFASVTWISRSISRRDVALREMEDAKASVRHPRFDWPRGFSYTYALTWKGESHVTLPGDDESKLDASFDFAAHIVLRSLGKKGTSTLFSAELTETERHSFQALGKDLLPSDDDAARLTRRDSWLEMAEDGVVQKMWLRRDDSDIFKTVMQSVLTHLTVTLPTDHLDTWTATEWSLIGHSTSHYEANEDASTLIRTRKQYDSVTALPGGRCDPCAQNADGQTRIVMDRGGHIQSMDDREQILVTREGAPDAAVRATDSFTLTLLSLGAFEPPTDFELDLAHLEVRLPGVVSASGDSSRKILEQQIAGLTYDQMVTSIVVTGLQGGAPEPGFMTRAVGLLIEHPQTIEKLTEIFQEKGTKSRSRALILDLLASAGSSEAQAAMRETLSSPAGKSDPQYQLLIQRFTLLQKPDAKSAEFISSIYEDATQRKNDSMRYAAAYSLGAIAGELSKHGDEPAARGYDAKLKAALSRATTSKEKGALITAIGGEGRRENLHTLIAYSTERDPSVRASVAGALRTVDDPETRTVIFTLVSDADPVVQSAALGALDHREIHADDVKRLSNVVLAGQTNLENDAGLVSFLAKHADAGPDVRQMLLFLMQRTSDPQLQARIRYVLAQMSGH